MPLEEIILSLLRLQKGHISAKNLANETGVSIRAISKRINLLRKYGYDIESSHRRGYRLVSKWLSPKGGIWLSVVLRPSMPASNITLLPFAAALAVCDAIKKTTQLDAKLRWPNDITISGKKVAGILIDSSVEAERINYAVIGIGVNANVDWSMISLHLEKSIKVTSLSNELGHETSMLGLTKEILERLEYYYTELEHSTPHTIIEKWKKSSDILGQKVELMQSNRTIQGIAADVKDDGSLLVKVDNYEDINVVASDIYVRY
jgi:BirA family biotin operon repressor/biotin-[acetyl-CoA-carboxylase] ligase